MGKSVTPERLISKLWNHIKNQEWDSAKSLLSEDFEALWPQSCEKFNRDNFIEVNRTYPGTHKIEIMNVWTEHDQWEHTDTVISEVFIRSTTPEGKKVELFAISIFETEHIDDLLVKSVREYWADTYAVPEWRKHLSTPYDCRGVEK
ncbi:MAG: hypothetical protein IPK68_09465 [Bdellovibrionales bacterium]|nr:hypothetical protein [Bdellovibrionales bacterium]